MAAWAGEVEADAKRDALAAAASDARIRYVTGDEPATSDVGRSAYRAVCRQEEPSRVVSLDAYRDNAREHARSVSDWYARNCAPAPAASVSSYAVISRETGHIAGIGDVPSDLLAVCLADAGLPPSREYEPTGAELLARAQRDACDAAQ